MQYIQKKYFNDFDKLVSKEVKDNLKYISDTYYNKTGMGSYGGDNIIDFKNKNDFVSWFMGQWYGDKNIMFWDYVNFHWSHRFQIPKTRIIPAVLYHPNKLIYFNKCVNVWSFELNELTNKSLYYRVHYVTNLKLKKILQNKNINNKLIFMLNKNI